MRILVVGAGLGGVAAAAGLNGAGHEVFLCEQAEQFREAGTAILIAPNGVRALEALGFGDYTRAHALHASGGGFRDWRGRPLLVADINAAQQTTGTLAMTGRLDLHRALREPLPDEVVHLGMPVDRLEQDDAEVWAVSGGQRVTSADVAVVADGIGSGLRRLLFPGHPGLRQTGRLDLRGMLAVPDGLALDGLLASNLIDRRTGSGFGLYPVGDDRLYWYTDSVLHGEPPTPEQARRDVLALTADWHPAVPALIEATSPADIFVDAIACLAAPLPAFNVGRIALMGDAAHAMPPDLGQGASQAFEDAAELVRVLDRTHPKDVAGRLHDYDARRRPQANKLLRQAQLVSRMTSLTGTGGWLRDALLRAIPSQLAVRQAARAYQPSK